MRSDRRAAVAIVGGGFSGTMVAAHLAKRGIPSILIDGSGRAGRGVAYSTPDQAHLLNVRAEGMSAWPDDPSDFGRRFQAEGGDPRGFAQRRLFGRYLGDILDQAVASGSTEVVHATAASAAVNGTGWRVSLDDGSAIEADALVLAIGNQEPESLRPFVGAGDSFIANPWGEEARGAVRDLVDSGGRALVIGTGLTMVDFALSLEAAGFAGRLLAVSRRGQLPRAHADTQPAPVEREHLPSGNLRALWRWLRRRSAELGWRSAVDGLRPHTAFLWQSLGTDQQQRFLRHARPWWDVHRHRIAPEVAAVVTDMIADGRLEVAAGRIISAAAADGGVDVRIRRRGDASEEAMRFDWVFNCTGPLHAIERTKDSLLRSLFDTHCIRSDQLGIGLEVDERSRSVAGERLWAVGPLTKGRYWEIIAVPDIREQAAAVAQDIATELGR